MINPEFMILISFVAFGPFLCILMSVAQIMKKDRRLSLYYSLAHLTMGVWLFQGLIYSVNFFENSHYIYTLILPVTFLAPLFQRYRYTWVVFNRNSFSSIFPGLLYSFMIISLLFIIYIFISFSKSELDMYLKFSPIISDNFISLPLIFRFLHILYPIPKIISIISLVSLIIIIAKYWREKKGDAPVRFLMMSTFILSLITIATALVLAGDLFSHKLCVAGLSIATLTICIMVIISYRYPSLRKYLIFELEKTRYTKSKIKSLDVDAIINRIIETMEIEKAFSDEDFSLKTLARDLDISPQQLSQIINEKLGKNFNTFLNEYRISEAKKLLIDEPARSINSISNAVGFNSNTAFTLAFSRYEGSSPSRYRKNNI